MIFNLSSIRFLCNLTECKLKIIDVNTNVSRWSCSGQSIVTKPISESVRSSVERPVETFCYGSKYLRIIVGDSPSECKLCYCVYLMSKGRLNNTQFTGKVPVNKVALSRLRNKIQNDFKKQFLLYNNYQTQKLAQLPLEI